jgi:hypothetical protein
LKLNRTLRSILVTSKSLTVTTNGFGVASLPASVGWTTDSIVGAVTSNTESSGFATSGCESTSFTVFHNWLADPVNARVVSDNNMWWVNKDDFEVFVCGILVDPVRVQDTQVTSDSSSALFSNTSKVSGEFKLVDSLVLGFSMDDSLGNRALAATTANSNSVNNKALTNK